jgi:hypothetical protein
MEATTSGESSLPKAGLPAEFKRGADVAPDPAFHEATDISLRIERYGSRYWAVFDGPELVCVTVYRKGARAVVELVTSLRTSLQQSN